MIETVTKLSDMISHVPITRPFWYASGLLSKMYCPDVNAVHFWLGRLRGLSALQRGALGHGGRGAHSPAERHPSVSVHLTMGTFEEHNGAREEWLCSGVGDQKTNVSTERCSTKVGRVRGSNGSTIDGQGI